MNAGEIKKIVFNNVSSVVIISRLFNDDVVEFVIKPSELLRKLQYEDDDRETTCQVVGNDIWVLGTPINSISNGDL